MKIPEEKFWIVRQWFYDPADVEAGDGDRYYDLGAALDALDETNMDAPTSGTKEGSIYEVTPTYVAVEGTKR